MDYERCEEERRGCINLAEHRCVSLAERHSFKYSSAFSPQIMKCIFCYDTRLKYGKPPACVEACPQEALLFGKRDDLIKIGRRRIKENRLSGRLSSPVFTC
jgi:Fe-S-cluster-containing dehydrogenase component